MRVHCLLDVFAVVELALLQVHYSSPFFSIRTEFSVVRGREVSSWCLVVVNPFRVGVRLEILPLADRRLRFLRRTPKEK